MKYIILSYFDFALFRFICNLEIHFYLVVRCNIKGVKVQQLLVKIAYCKRYGSRVVERKLVRSYKSIQVICEDSKA